MGGLFAADNERQRTEVPGSLPLRGWMTIEVTPFAPHPNDPAGRKA